MPKLNTALITGSSEGIGRSFAEVYAKNGHDLVLVARNAAKLMDFASELKAKYAVEVHVFAADLIPVDAAQKLFEAIRLKEIKVDILVNNAGMMQVEKLSLSDSQQLNNLLQGIAEELRGTGVSVTCVCPGMTETKMLSHADGFEKFIPKFLKADPMELAAQAYKASMKGEVVFLDKVANKLLVQMATHYPRWMVRSVNGLFARFK